MAYKFDYTKRKKHPLYKVIKPIAAAVIKSKYKITYIGVENIPLDRGVVIAPNHITALDPLIVGAGCPKCDMYFIAKEELFENKVVGWFLSQLNSFPVNRDKFDYDAINYAVDIVKDGCALGIFPEGTRSKDFKPQKGKGGIGYIVKQCKCDVVPVSIYTSDEAKSGTRLTVRYGKPIKYEEFNIDEESKKMKDLRKVSELVMSRITELWEEGHGD